jgi:hypothetical protein
MLQVITLTLVLFSLTNTWAGVGKVTEQTGPTEIVRARQSISSAVNTAVEMNDTIVTARARAELTFEDATKVRITEQSKLIIDEFVYDPKSGTGKLAMKVALGTARYASGQIAKNSPQQVAVKTPTASIAVRGTDFSMTVDELGRSLIMLLPSCDDKTCVTGQIEVSNQAGSILMTQAYQATLIATADTPPTKPVVVTIDQANINNMLIISKPREISDESRDNRRETRTALDVNFLDQDFLKPADLENQLDAFNRLDRNELEDELLPNVLDAVNASLSATQEAMSTTLSMLPGYNESSGLKWRINDQEQLTLTKYSTHIFELTVPREQGAILDLQQDGVPVYQKINTGGTTTIAVIQSQ